MNMSNKQITKRRIDANEVIFIFEKFLEGWKTIHIYNTIEQTNPSSQITKNKLKIFQLKILKYTTMN